MAYCEITDVQKMIPDAVLIRLSDDEGAGAINTTRVQESIDSGGEEIDSYIGQVCALPIGGTAPPILGKLNVDIAIYNLYSRLQEKIPETRQTRYDNAIKILMKIANGEMTFGLQPEPAEPETTSFESIAETRDQIFTSDTLDMY